jgi:hypothetical protein
MALTHPSVADLDAWRPTYEANRPGRQEAGVTSPPTAYVAEAHS